MTSNGFPLLEDDDEVGREYLRTEVVRCYEVFDAQRRHAEALDALAALPQQSGSD